MLHEALFKAGEKHFEGTWQISGASGLMQGILTDVTEK
jgi:hypothetical protein